MGIRNALLTGYFLESQLPEIKAEIWDVATKYDNPGKAAEKWHRIVVEHREQLKAIRARQAAQREAK